MKYSIQKFRIMENQLTIKNFKFVSGSFSGPLDLLLSLIESKKMEITEISIAKVTDDFIIYLGDIRKIEPIIIADFLSLATKLLLIKSKSILPTLEIDEEEEEEIENLTKKLEIYQKFREANKILKNLYLKTPLFARDSFINQKPVFFPPNITKEELRDIFENIWQEFKEISQEIEVKKISKIIKIEEKIQEILNILSKNINISFNKLSENNSKQEIIVSFLAILQLLKNQFLVVKQEEVFGEINILQKN
jgi:segregation and condensation protein A